MSTRYHVAALVLLLVACKSGRVTGDDTHEDDATVTLEILSPTAGAVVETGEIVLLSARAHDSDGLTLVIEAATWSAGDWSVAGNDVSVDDLPVGALDLGLTAMVDGEAVTASVSVTVEEPVVDPGEDVDYEGLIAAHIYYDGSYGTFDDPCEGWVAFTLLADDTLAGLGSCRAFGEDWEFTVEGTRDGETLSGELSMTFKKAVIPTAFTGAVDVKGHADASFSEEFYPGDGEWLLIEGTFTSDPVAL